VALGGDVTCAAAAAGVLAAGGPASGDALPPPSLLPGAGAPAGDGVFLKKEVIRLDCTGVALAPAFVADDDMLCNV
jgi:hypothetical protein